MIEESINKSIGIKQKILNDKETLSKISQCADMLMDCFKNNGKVLIAGNGGSAGDAQHFVAELIGRYKKERKGLPAISLSTDSSVLTALSNDYGFEQVFSRQIVALGNENDVFIGISTSGDSQNIINALSVGKQKNMKTMCLLGKDGGLSKGNADLDIIVLSDDVARVQEAHIMLIHIICELIDNKLQ
ncbi:MAG: D-sedoheptulose 7-phosphate isomerase [bacterium]